MTLSALIITDQKLKPDRLENTFKQARHRAAHIIKRKTHVSHARQATGKGWRMGPNKYFNNMHIRRANALVRQPLLWYVFNGERAKQNRNKGTWIQTKEMYPWQHRFAYLQIHLLISRIVIKFTEEKSR